MESTKREVHKQRKERENLKTLPMLLSFRSSESRSERGIQTYISYVRKLINIYDGIWKT